MKTDPEQERLIPFISHPLLRGSHRQTIISYYLPGPQQLSRSRTHEVKLDDGDKLVICENQPNRKSPLQKIIVLIHGLGGDDSSPYMIRLTDLFYRRGWTVIRMNHRGCGSGTGKAKLTYHSGKSDDISKALLEIQRLHPGVPMVACGFSMSGNALLKLLGEKRFPIPGQLHGSIAITPPIDLSMCATALHKPQNRIYELRFVKLLRQAIFERKQAFSDFPDFHIPWYISIRQFDDVCTAPLHNFESAEHYYEQCSAKRFLSGITSPVFLLASADDPFIPSETFKEIPENDYLDFCLTEKGGHMGFVAHRKTPLATRRWLDYVVLWNAENFIKKSQDETSE